MAFLRVGLLFFPLAVGGVCWGQDALYSRVNTFSTFAEYSNDSSRILLGNAVNRKIGAVGFGYEWRLLHGHSLDLSYAAEWRPGMLESDPTEIVTNVQTSPVSGTETFPPEVVLKCVPGTAPYSFALPGIGTVSGTDTTRCGRQQVIEQGLTPLGFRLNGRTSHRVQPTFRAGIGFLFSTHPVPTPNNGYFNVLFDFAAGVELWQSHRSSARLEYVVQHYGNLGTVAGFPSEGIDGNPGVDNGFVKLTFAWGR